MDNELKVKVILLVVVAHACGVALGYLIAMDEAKTHVLIYLGG